MPEDDATDRSGSTGRSDWKGRLVSRFLTPIAAAAASAAAGYAVKKAPDVLERALPKLRSLAPDTDSVGELPGRAASAATNAAAGVGDLAQDLGGRAKALVTPGQPTNGGGADRKGSLQELAQRRDERTRSREARRKARSS
jgi:hypothetical protein